MVNSKEKIRISQNDSSTPSFQGGRLQQFWKKWQIFPKTVAEWIREGIPIHSEKEKWIDIPLRSHFSEKEDSWLKSEISDLLKTNIIEIGNKDTVINPIHVVPKKGKDQFRLILDLRSINAGINNDSFKMDHIHKTLKFLSKDMLGIKIDLMKGYHHVPVKETDRKLLGFRYNGQIYHYKCLPFGLNIAPRLFSKIMKVLVQRWRVRGISVFIYLDDILVVNHSKDQLILDRDIVLKDLEEFGFFIQKDKCCLNPSQLIEYLGVLLDFHQGLVKIPEDKRITALEFIEELLNASQKRLYVPCKRVAKFLGKLEFLTIANKYLSPFMCRLRKNMVSVVSGRGWHASMQIHKGAFKDLLILRELIQKNDGHPFELDWILPVIVNSDATPQGFGIHSGSIVTVGKFNGEEHINVKELRALLLYFKQADELNLYPDFTNFELRVDNMVAVAYLKKGYGSKDDLAKIARDISKILMRRNWWICKVIYIPSKQNFLADRLSRLMDWGSTKELIELVNQEFGIHHVDRFATTSSATTLVFNSWKENDAFKSLWEKELVSYCVPPIGLISQALIHLIKSRSIATFVIPEWSSSIWWPLLLKLLKKRKSITRRMLLIKPLSELWNKFEGTTFIIAHLDGNLYFKPEI